ncbi:hypothetical protein GCM10009733_017700 [Nonomuraea maheshkhaliensis]|uniref:HTH tetR-type domain-containing protein n=2 Tax=Nonomuraea maheshkhaliensis TaxID=419590 RepID=A0ABN2EXV5_9ACTN
MDGKGSRPSVRAVAARAGVGASTLRHHFRTQHDLVDAVLESMYRQALPDERIHDVSVPADIRLTECLSGLLTPVGSPEQAREMWRQLFRTFVDSEQREAGAGYAALVRHARNRVESWLEVLEAEGALPAGDRAFRAIYLATVVDGLAVARALPEDEAVSHYEAAILRAAVNAVLRLPWAPTGATSGPEA